MHPSIFKAYDIRGVYPEEIDEKTAYLVGQAAAEELSAKTLAVGRDARESGPSLQKALMRGIVEAGCNVIDLGMITTPMLYFASWKLDGVDGAIAVTASHNPAQYNGIKICRRNAVPVGSVSGLDKIRDKVLAGNRKTQAPKKAVKPGQITSLNIKKTYEDYVASFADFGNGEFSLVIDCANTMGVLELPIYRRFKNIKLIELYCDLDNAYRAHEANPLNTATLDELREEVVSRGASMGIAYDGDADRIGFVDERGEIIPMDLVTGLIAKILLEKNPGATILYDLRSSMAVPEVIAEAGGRPRECRVGHAFIKKQMDEEDALFAGELSGHYYFQANKFGELSTYAAFLLLNLMAKTGKNISELTADLRRYHHSGEINSKVNNPEMIMKKLQEAYADGELSTLDGIKISYWRAPQGQRWWFNVRASNTEPVLRLNLEADTPELMKTKRDEVLQIIRG